MVATAFILAECRVLGTGKVCVMKKAWVKPELKRMVAGGAEASTGARNEPATGGGSSRRS